MTPRKTVKATAKPAPDSEANTQLPTAEATQLPVAIEGPMEMNAKRFLVGIRDDCQYLAILLDSYFADHTSEQLSQKAIKQLTTVRDKILTLFPLPPA